MVFKIIDYIILNVSDDNLTSMIKFEFYENKFCIKYIDKINTSYYSKYINKRENNI